MRLTIIPLVNPTEQQYIDLSKIWIDQSREKLTQLLGSGQLFFGARFNDRLLAAAKVTVHQHQGVINDFCVREVTRRRGVGLYLLQEIIYQLPKITLWIFNLGNLEPQHKITMEKFLTAGGFHQVTQSDRWELNASY